MPNGSAVRGNVHVLRVGSLQGYEVHAFATLLRHLANYRLAARNFRLHKSPNAKSFQTFFQRKLCSNERFNVCLSIVHFSQMKGPWLWSLVREKSGWFLWAESENARGFLLTWSTRGFLLIPARAGVPGRRARMNRNPRGASRAQE